ncbi:unnamed protein product, partial [Discosporangium mesarthrocarpum]
MRVLLLDPRRVVTSQNVIFRHIPAWTVSAKVFILSSEGRRCSWMTLLVLSLT